MPAAVIPGPEPIGPHLIVKVNAQMTAEQLEQFEALFNDDSNAGEA